MVKNYIVDVFDAEEVIRQKEIFFELSKTYQEIFNFKGEHEWGENWSIEEVKSYLMKCLTQQNSTNIVIILKDLHDNKIIGFHIGHIGKVNDVILSDQMPKDLKSDEKKFAEISIKKSIDASNSKNILYAQDLGILINYRSGSKKLSDLFLPMMEIAVKQGATLGVYWTSKNSKLFNLSKIVNAKELFNFNDPQNNSILLFELKKLIEVCKLDEQTIKNFFSKNILKQVI